MLDEIHQTLIKVVAATAYQVILHIKNQIAMSNKNQFESKIDQWLTRTWTVVIALCIGTVVAGIAIVIMI